MKSVVYVDVAAMMERLVGTLAADEDGELLFPLAALQRAIALSPQLCVKEPDENDNAHF